MGNEGKRITMKKKLQVPLLSPLNNGRSKIRNSIRTARNLNIVLVAIVLLTSCKKQLSVDGLETGKSNARLVATASPVGDVVGKVTVGYQGWFSCVGDGSPMGNSWWHWSSGNDAPNPANIGINAWPDMREFTKTYQTGFSNLGNGQPAKLFSSFDDQTIDTHFKWMQDNGIDVAALQRFDPTGGEGPFRDAITVKVRKAAEAHSRKFYIMYDISGWDNMQSQIKTDWTAKMSAYTASTAYAKQNGKPVVCIWGLGFPDRSITPAAELDVINWFKAQGCYVIGGVPHEWRDYTKAGDKNFDPVFKALNMISPWMIGAIGTIQDSDNFYANYTVPDMAYCKANGIDYQPCVEPGDVAARQRVHGDFMWRQFYNVIRAGAQGIYISMFDEFNEGNQIAKTAENSSMIPQGSSFLGLDEDGVPCSSDYYLRLTNDGGKMLKGIIPLTSVRPTPPIAGGDPQHLPPYGQTISLKGTNNLFVSSENGDGPMHCNRTSVGGWEGFTLVNAGSGKVALLNDGMYVSSENGGAPITCNRTAVGPWEQFTYILNTDGTLMLKGNNGGFISMEDGVLPMTCTRQTAGATEKFSIN
jgi:hypothetical protein